MYTRLPEHEAAHVPPQPEGHRPAPARRWTDVAADVLALPVTALRPGAAVPGFEDAFQQFTVPEKFSRPGRTAASAQARRARAPAQVGSMAPGPRRQVPLAHEPRLLEARPNPQATIVRDGSGRNFDAMLVDMQRALQCALRWQMARDPAYADQAVRYLNAWSRTMKRLKCGSGGAAAAGLYGYQWANAAELLRRYAGWAPEDKIAFQAWLQRHFYPRGSGQRMQGAFTLVRSLNDVPTTGRELVCDHRGVRAVRWRTALAMGRGLLQRTIAGGWQEAAASAAAAVRALAHLPALGQLLQNPLFATRIAKSAVGHPLFPVRHRHYLARGLPVPKRMGQAATHFDYEAIRFSAAYYRNVYGGPGLELWHAQVEDRRYAIVLRDSDRLRHEGPLSVALVCGTRTLHLTSFTWSRPSCEEALQAGVPDMFIGKSQSTRADAPWVEEFRRDFPQHAPAYLCMAATLGIAQALGCPWVHAVRHEWQVAFEESLAATFRRSYDEFWESFGGQVVSVTETAIPVPMALPPIETVSQKHRSRARVRRKLWAEIADGASAVTSGHLRPLTDAVGARRRGPQPTPPGQTAGGQGSLVLA